MRKKKFHTFVNLTYKLSLCPKSYKAVCYDKIAAEDKDAEKVACKGVSKLMNKYGFDQYKDVLYKHDRFSATNFVIRPKDRFMRTMKCKKTGLAGVHVKGRVQEDRVSIVPHTKHQIPL